METKNKVGKRIALAVEAKHGLVAEERLMIQVFLANPQSVALLAFFATERELYSTLEIIPVVVTMTNVPVVFENEVKEESAFDLLPDTQNLVGCLLGLRCGNFHEVQRRGQQGYSQ